MAENKKMITTEILKRNGFYTSIVGEYYHGIFSIENDDKNIEIDINIWINIKNPKDVQMCIFKIDKTIKKKYVSTKMLDTHITDIEQIDKFLKAFNIDTNFKF